MPTTFQPLRKKQKDIIGKHKCKSHNTTANTTTQNQGSRQELKNQKTTANTATHMQKPQHNGSEHKPMLMLTIFSKECRET